MIQKLPSLVFYKKGALKNLFNKVTGLRPPTLLKKQTPAQVLFCEFSQISSD